VTLNDLELRNGGISPNLVYLRSNSLPLHPQALNLLIKSRLL